MKVRLPALPPEISEGKFAFFSRAAINTIPLPETDRTALWPVYDQYRDRFVALKADCAPGKPVTLVLAELLRFILSREGQRVILDQAIFLPLRETQASVSRAALN